MERMDRSGGKKWNGSGSNPFVVFVVVLGQRCFKPWGNVLILSQWADGWHIFLITSLSVIDYSCLTPLPQAVSLTVHTATFAPNAIWTTEYKICFLLFFLFFSFMSIKSLRPCNHGFDCNLLWLRGENELRLLAWLKSLLRRTVIWFMIHTLHFSVSLLT